MFLKKLFLSSLLSWMLTSATTVTDPSLNKRRPAHPLGTIITSCTVPDSFAITLDDGPFSFTDQILDSFAESGMKATFFLNGQNWGNINNYAGVVQRMLAEGHQVASHTWSHTDLTTISQPEIESQMEELENAFLDIIGRIPTYMRLPYLSANDVVLQTLGDLSYHVISTDLDTLDYDNKTPDTIQNAVNNFEVGLDNGGTIALAHEVHQTTADILVPAMISALQARGKTSVTVGQCLGDTDGWYQGPR